MPPLPRFPALKESFLDGKVVLPNLEANDGVVGDSLPAPGCFSELMILESRSPAGVDMRFGVASPSSTSSFIRPQVNGPKRGLAMLRNFAVIDVEF